MNCNTTSDMCPDGCQEHWSPPKCTGENKDLCLITLSLKKFLSFFNILSLDQVKNIYQFVDVMVSGFIYFSFLRMIMQVVIC